MRHKKSGRKLGRNSTHRDALFRNMVTSLLQHGRIKTTEAKAKELRGFAERTISKSLRVHDILVKPDDARTHAEQLRVVHAMRVAGETVRDRAVLLKLFSEIRPAMHGRPGGYTRILRLGRRAGDAAPMALIELVGFENQSTADA